MSRVDQERVTINIDGVGLGVFDSFAGGASKAEDTKNRPGGMGPEESLGGPVSRDAFTVGRLYNLERDHPRMKMLDGKVGFGRVVAVRQKLNRDKSPAGDPTTYTGTLIAYTMPDHDSNSGDKAVFSLEVSADEAIA
jgi:hypothetical protein